MADPATFAFAERLGAGVVVVDRDWVIISANRIAVGWLGWDTHSVVGRELADFVDGGELLRTRLGNGEGRATFPEVQIGPAGRRVVADVTADAGDEDFVLTFVDAGGRLAAEGEAGKLRDRLAESEKARFKLRSIQEELTETAAPPVMVGASQGLRRVRDQIARVASADTTVLIQGETGSGKELVARAIHAESPRGSAAFVPVNCAALPESLIESELFGHERGAFTGADRRRLGKFELADGGTLFLDEIAELPLQAQAKLLRVLQHGTFERVGGAETLRVDVRLVAATHRDLARRVERALFREDLFYRLNVFRIDVPPLRERREDLTDLARHLHEQAAKRMAKPVRPLSASSVRRMMAYRWPGNIRELANAVERATLLADGAELEIELPDSPSPETASGDDQARAGRGRDGVAPTRDILLDLTLEQLQRLQIMHALESCDYRVFGTEGAADKLDINPNTLLSRMDKFGIPRPRLMKGAKGLDGN